MNRLTMALSVFCLMCTGQGFAGSDTIGHLFEDKSPVVVHVTAVTNESGQDQVSVDEFKAALERSFNERKAMDFDTVDNPAESDIGVVAVIEKYQYLERGPFKPSPGIATTLADAAATANSNYVEMEVRYTVTDAKTGDVLWTDDVEGYIKKVMTPTESIPLIFDKITRALISQCFGRPHKRGMVKPLT